MIRIAVAVVASLVAASAVAAPPARNVAVADAAPATPTAIDTVHRAVSGDDVGGLLDAMGLSASREAGPEGAPMYLVELDGVKTALLLEDCIDGVCARMEMWAGFALSSPVDLVALNDWNADHPGTRAYLDREGDPVLQSDLALTGGVSAEAMQAFVQRFSTEVGAFTDLIGFDRS